MKFKDTFWSQCLAVLVLVLFLPLLVVMIPVIAIAQEIECIRERRRYKKSRYFLDLGIRYRCGITGSPAYRLYESALSRELAMEFRHLSSPSVDYCLHQGSVYILPDFDSLGTDENDHWVVDRDGDTRSLEEEMHLLSSALEEYALSPIKILVERNMIPIVDLHSVSLPEQICLVQTYETAFGEEQPLLRIPQSGQELYELMLATEDLCGTFELSGDTISWNLYDGIHIEISVAPQDCMISIEKKLTGITHWHPTCYEIYDEVCKVGKRGNVLVMRTFLSGASVLYMGPKADCPYDAKKKWSWGRMYYLEAK